MTAPTITSFDLGAIRNQLTSVGYAYVRGLGDGFDHPLALTGLGPLVPQYGGALVRDVKPDPATNALSIVNPTKKYALAYPISTYTYVIVPTKSDKAPELRKFLFWAVTKGQAFGPKLLFQPIPKPVLVVAEKTIAKIKS